MSRISNPSSGLSVNDDCWQCSELDVDARAKDGIVLKRGYYKVEVAWI
jgi:hypothetical protein